MKNNTKKTNHREIPLSINSRILAINVARIGDTMLATPLFRALKKAQNNIHLTCISHPKRAEVLQNLDFIDEILTITKRSTWLHRGKRWNAAFVLGNDEQLVRFALHTSEYVVAFKQKNIALNEALHIAVEKPRHHLHAVKERLLLANAAGIQNNDLRLAYNPTETELNQAHVWLAAHAPTRARPLIGVQMSSFPSKAYRDWPVENFIDLAKHVLTTHPLAYFVILGGQDDLVRAKQFHHALPHSSTLAACGRLSLRETAALISQLDLYIGVDTGPTHIAGALNIPMVALYHCFHPGNLLAPLQRQAPLIVIEHPLTGLPCERTSPMTLITVDQVWKAVNTIISRQPS